jgi:hypothetical protein
MHRDSERASEKERDEQNHALLTRKKYIHMQTCLRHTHTHTLQHITHTYKSLHTCSACRKELKVDRTDALKEEEAALKARWQKEEDDSAATLLKEKEEMEEQEANVNAQYCKELCVCNA